MPGVKSSHTTYTLLPDTAMTGASGPVPPVTPGGPCGPAGPAGPGGPCPPGDPSSPLFMEVCLTCGFTTFSSPIVSALLLAQFVMPSSDEHSFCDCPGL